MVPESFTAARVARAATFTVGELSYRVRHCPLDVLPVRGRAEAGVRASFQSGQFNAVHEPERLSERIAPSVPGTNCARLSRVDLMASSIQLWIMRLWSVHV